MKVAVIGDIIIDEYINGTSYRLSPEGPIPIVSYLSTNYKLGGAGNVYTNLKSLGINTDLFGVMDYEYVSHFSDVDFTNSIPGKCSVKTRVFSDNHYVTRIDKDCHSPYPNFLGYLQTIDFSDYKYIVMSDYAKGVLDQSKEIISFLNESGCKVIVDPKRPMHHYKGAWLCKPNDDEYYKWFFPNTDNIIITSPRGVNAKINGIEYHLSSDNVEVNDVTGAGDCFMAAFVWALTMDFSYELALSLAMKCATESVRHKGTYIITKEFIDSICT